MDYSDIYKLNEIVATYHSSYLAANTLAESARQLAQRYDNRILESEALSWLITGKMPSILEQDDHDVNKCSNYLKFINNQVDRVLSEVDDIDVCESVRDSIKESNIAQHLIYVYSCRMDEYREARVRILARMIWYTIHPYYKEDEQ